MRLEITFDDKANVKKKLLAISDQVKDWRPAFERVGQDMLQAYGVESFEKQGIAGESWRPLANATRKARMKRWGYYKQAPMATDRILIWTGRLKSGFRKQVTRDYLRVFNVVPYFKYHQKPGGRPPQRRMMAVTKDTIIRTMTILNDYMREQINKPL